MGALCFGDRYVVCVCAADQEVQAAPTAPEFSTAIHAGERKRGSELIRAAVLTISDKGARGEREDKSGQVIRDLLGEIPAEEVSYEVVPDEQEIIESKLRELALKADLVVTTGGTGVAPRDVTPEATRQVIDRELPGFGEAMRMESFRKTPFALVSRAMAGFAGQTLILNLPGSPKAVDECLRVVLPAIGHTIEKALGDSSDCAEPEKS